MACFQGGAQNEMTRLPDDQKLRVGEREEGNRGKEEGGSSSRRRRGRKRTTTRGKKKRPRP